MVSENHMEPINTPRFKCQQQVVHIVSFSIEMVNESYMVIRSLVMMMMMKKKYLIVAFKLMMIQ